VKAMKIEKKGLKRAEEIYQNRPKRVMELKEEGKKVFGYPCMYVPLEMISALGIIPYRTCGDISEPVTEADRGLPTSFCSIMRSCLDCALKGKNDFLDGMVTVHSSDPQEKTARIWESYTNYPYFHFIDMPGTLRSESFKYYITQLNNFKKTLESFTGNQLSPDRLKETISLYNSQRGLVRNLYELTKSDPPLISGTEIVQVIKAIMSIPVEEGNNLLREVIDEVKGRKDGPKRSPARVMIWSSTIDSMEIMEVIEGRANVVVDDHCGGLRPYRGEVRITDDPIEGISHYYMEEITCARTFKEASIGSTKKDYKKDLESRYSYLKSLIDKWKVNGVIMLLVRYCDPFAYEMPSLKDYLNSLKIQNTYIEYDYSKGSLAPLRTRVEAFLEQISQ
jgi:bcr-type benzoyl-CoA reductase subunit C